MHKVTVEVLLISVLIIRLVIKHGSKNLMFSNKKNINDCSNKFIKYQIKRIRRQIRL